MLHTTFCVLRKKSSWKQVAKLGFLSGKCCSEGFVRRHIIWATIPTKTRIQEIEERNWIMHRILICVWSGFVFLIVWQQLALLQRRKISLTLFYLSRLTFVHLKLIAKIDADTDKLVWRTSFAYFTIHFTIQIWWWHWQVDVKGEKRRLGPPPSSFSDRFSFSSHVALSVLLKLLVHM